MLLEHPWKFIKCLNTKLLWVRTFQGKKTCTQEEYIIFVLQNSSRKAHWIRKHLGDCDKCIVMASASNAILQHAVNRVFLLDQKKSQKKHPRKSFRARNDA